MGFRLAKPSSCSGCPLERVSSGFVEPEGMCTNGVLIVGEAADEHASRDGYPFRPYGDAGSLLRRAIGMSGFKYEQFGVFNVLACKPPRNPATGMNDLAGMPFEVAALDSCRVHLLKVIKRYRPKVILAMGAVALRSLTGLTGDRLNLEYIRGFALGSNIDFRTELIGIDGHSVCSPVSDRDYSQLVEARPASIVVGTYHPGMIKRGAWALLPVMIKDIKFAVRVAQNGPPTTDDFEYVTHGNEGNLECLRDDLKRNPDMALSIDVETNYAELKEAIFQDEELITPSMAAALADQRKQDITQLNYSVRERSALVVPATPSHMRLVKEIHATPNVKIGHNIVMYDQIHCETNGVPLQGELEDTMWRFHHIYPDLPGSWKKKAGDNDYREQGSIANLQFCASFYGFEMPWKHLSGSDAEWYGGCDADSALRVFWGTDADMRRLGDLVHDGYYRMVQQLLPILDNMRRRGIPVNRKTLMELHHYLIGEIRQVDSDIQLVAPVELRPIHPVQGLKKVPKGDLWPGMPVDIKKKKNGQVEITQGRLIQIEVDLPAEYKVCCMRARKPGKNPKLFAKYENHPKAHLRGDVLFAPNPACKKCGGEGSIDLEQRTEVRWTRELPFNAASSDQMWSYVHYRGYEVKKNSKRVFAMDAETIEKLAKQYQDPLFTKAVQKRKLVKMDSTYALGWMPGPDERVHPQIGCYPATGQLSSRKPNSQNVPNVSKQGELAVKFRRGIWAEPGHVIVELDMKSFHVQTLGFECGDPVYIGLAKTDIHSFFAATGLLKLEDRDKLLSNAQANLMQGKADPELLQLLKWYRKNGHSKTGEPFSKVRDGRAKVAVLGYGLGMMEKTLYLQNEDSFADVNEAAATLRAMDATFPIEKKYRDTQPLEANRNGYRIINRYGFIRWFFNVQKLNRRAGKWDHGDDWEAAIAFNVQATAHGHLREVIKRNEWDGYNDKYEFINTVHDSIVFHPRVEDLEECIFNVQRNAQHESEFMLMPWAGGRGLSVECEAKFGPNWADMCEITI